MDDLQTPEQTTPPSIAPGIGVSVPGVYSDAAPWMKDPTYGAAKQREKTALDAETDAQKKLADFYKNKNPEFAKLQEGYKETPAAPTYKPGELDHGDLVVWGLVAALGAMATRQPAMNAMNALTAALTAHQKGDKDRYEQAVKAYKEQADVVAKHNQTVERQINSWIKDKDMTAEGLEANVKALHLQGQEAGKEAKGIEDTYTKIANYKRLVAQTEASRQKIEKGLESKKEQFKYPPGTMPVLTEDGSPKLTASGQPILQYAKETGEQIHEGKVAAQKDREQRTDLQRIRQEQAAQAKAAKESVSMNAGAVQSAAELYNAKGTLPRGIGSGDRNAILEKAQEIRVGDLVSSMADASKRNAIGSDFGRGARGKTVTAINTGAQHLAALENYITALENGDNQLANNIANKMRLLQGDPNTFGAEFVAEVLANEIVKITTGATNGGALADRVKARAELNVLTESPEQMASAVEVVKTLIAGRYDALKQDYINMRGEVTGYDNMYLPDTLKSIGPYTGEKNEYTSEFSEKPAVKTVAPTVSNW